MEKQTKGLAIGVAVGVIAGAIAGVLLAPKSGKETRTDIANYLHEIKDKIADELAKIGEISREKYHDIVERVVGAYENDKKITENQARDIKDDLNNNYDEVEKAVAKKEEE